MQQRQHCARSRLQRQHGAPSRAAAAARRWQASGCAAARRRTETTRAPLIERCSSLIVSDSPCKGDTRPKLRHLFSPASSCRRPAYPPFPTPMSEKDILPFLRVHAGPKARAANSPEHCTVPAAGWTTTQNQKTAVRGELYVQEGTALRYYTPGPAGSPGGGGGGGLRRPVAVAGRLARSHPGWASRKLAPGGQQPTHGAVG